MGRLSNLESAVYNATALIDLLITKIVEEDRSGSLTYVQSRWVSDLASLAAHVEVGLRDAFHAHHKAIRTAVLALRHQ